MTRTQRRQHFFVWLGLAIVLGLGAGGILAMRQVQPSAVYGPADHDAVGRDTVPGSLGDAANSEAGGRNR